MAADTAIPPANDKLHQLDPINVYTDRYKATHPDVSPNGPLGMRMLFGFQIGPILGLRLNMDKYVVTATRTPQPPERVAASTRIFEESEIRQSPAATVDDLLRSQSGFSLFRRTDSLIANPTAQGVSLRGLGPSGASRSLVLLNGVPLNDPFGGWVSWAQLPREAVARIEVVPGGGATAWGNAALGGVIQIFTLPPRSELMLVDVPPAPMKWVERGTVRFSAFAGDFGTRGVDFAVNHLEPRGIFQLIGNDFSTDGFVLIAPERRGSIDVPAWSRHRSVSGRWRQPIGSDSELNVTAREFEEFRGNGTPYQKNGTREKFVSVDFSRQPTDHFVWTTLAYAQDQSFASTFSSVNATRTAETPASDQYAVPAATLGGAWTGAWKHADGSRTSFGTDLRTVHGETRENFTFVRDAFTRQRVAGGAQDFAGIFALHEQPLRQNWRIVAGGRIDWWDDKNGHRLESDRTTGAVLRNDSYTGEHGFEFSPSAGFVWTPAGAWRIRGNAQQSFRRPTLNELYRPFRQGANVTEANPALKTERATSGELGAEWTISRTTMSERKSAGGPAITEKHHEAIVTFGATAFWNELQDPVGNVTLAKGPGTFPIVGTLAAGGIGRQRLNLERARVRGAEFTATWRQKSRLTWSASYLFDDATVQRASLAPALAGKRLAEVPRHTASFTATWSAPWQLTFTPRVRWIGRQYDDDENSLRLGEAVVCDLGIARPLTKNIEVFLNTENIGDTRVETARSADGVVNIGTPRFVFGGIRGKW
jgi:outer membrane receptor protein involved in Fe transport